MLSAAKVCLRIPSTSGISVVADAPPSVDRSSSMLLGSALAVERQMQAVLEEQDMGEKLRARAPACDRMRRGWWLCDRPAGPAGELLAHMLDHLSLPRHELQCLGHVL